MSPVPDEKSDARILATLRTHDEREGAILESYRRLVDESTDEGIRYLGRLIIEDEERHHRLITEMIGRIETWMHRGESTEATPSLMPRVDPDLLAETHKLIALEHEDAKELRLLKKELRYAPASCFVFRVHL